MRRCLGFVLGAVWAAAALGWGQGAVTLRWSWKVEAARSCSLGGGTLLLCQVSEGSSASVSLSVSSDPACTVHVAPVSAPPGWPAASPASGWGRVTTVYAFSPPPGSAGRRVEIVYRAWTDGIPSLDLKLAVEVSAPLPSCPPATPAPGASPGTEARLPWSAHRPITWDDFWGPPPADRDPTAGAGIATVLAFDLTVVTARDPGTGMWQAGIASLLVTAAMERDRSWALPERRTAAALAHEQGHFDLAEVYRRILDRELRGLSADGWAAADAEQELRTRAGEAFRRVSAGHSEVQALYDGETDHGRDTARQMAWERWIAAWLREPGLAPLP